jgi:hypothetical protein
MDERHPPPSRPIDISNAGTSARTETAHRTTEFTRRSSTRNAPDAKDNAARSWDQSRALEQRKLGETAEADALLLPSALLVPVLPKLLPALVFVDLRFATFLE